MAGVDQDQWLRRSGDEPTPLVFSRTILTFAATVTAVIMVAGIIGNALTIFAFWKTQRGNNVTTVFIVCLCAADLLFCLTVLPFNVLRFSVGGFKGEGLTCKILPFLQYGNVGVSLLFIAMITINRYIMIAHYHVYTKIYRTPLIIAMIVLCWVFSFGMQIPTLLGKWGTYAYDKRLSSCTILPDSNGRSAKSALFFVGFVIPCLVIIFCYTRIYFVVHGSESRMRKHASNNVKMSRKEQKEVKLKRNEWRITKMVLAIFLSFLVCYLPITIIKITDNKVQYPSYHILAYLLLYLSACINPIIYVIMNKQYRQAYKAVLTCRKPKLLSFRGQSSSLAGFKAKFVPNRSWDSTPKKFWASISICGPPYKELEFNNCQLEKRIESALAERVLNHQDDPTKPTFSVKTSRMIRRLPRSKTPIGSRILAGFDVDDNQLKVIKNKLLCDSPVSDEENKIIQFILEEDNFISHEEFRALRRRLSKDYKRFERGLCCCGKITSDTCMNEDNLTEEAECEGYIVEEPINWRGFGGDWSDDHLRDRNLSDSKNLLDLNSSNEKNLGHLSCSNEKSFKSISQGKHHSSKILKRSKDKTVALLSGSVYDPSFGQPFSLAVDHETSEELLSVTMHTLVFNFLEAPHSLTMDVDNFLGFCGSKMTKKSCLLVEELTHDQAENPDWFKIKFGRVTASQLHQVAQCKTPRGYLVKTILGLRTWFCGSEATVRGKRLESQVTALVEKRTGSKFRKCGIFLSGEYPILGASPDAINDECVMEIKCPFSDRTFTEYLVDGYKIGKRYMAQIQLQMFMTGRKKGLYVVAAPDFETSKRIEVIQVPFDKPLVDDLIKRATTFWKANIFPLLMKIKREMDRPPADYEPYADLMNNNHDLVHNNHEEDDSLPF